jgi:hypothetical protein
MALKKGKTGNKRKSAVAGVTLQLAIHPVIGVK